jgi:Transaldolase/Fructose-6-phosphate aldolase
MNATQRLHDLGQSLWLDDITRDLLTGGTLHRYIDELSVTGLTSNPMIFDHAITKSQALTPPSARRCRHIDSFDRWGVELGKALAPRIIP